VPKKFAEFIALNNELVLLCNALYFAQVNSKTGVYRGSPDPSENADPYTVSHCENGKVIMDIPYTEAYNEYVLPIRALLNTLIEWCTEKKVLPSENIFDAYWWHEYYILLDEAFRHNQWHEVEIHRLKWPEYSRFLLILGPIESYSDRICSRKKFFSGLFLDRFDYQNTIKKEDEINLNELWNEAVACASTWHDFVFGALTPIRARLFFASTLAKGGEIAQMDIRGWSLPQDGELAIKLGSTKIVLRDACLSSSKRFILSGLTLLKIIGVPDEDIELVNKNYEKLFFMYVLLHEYGHTFLQESGSDERLGRFYTAFEEARADGNALLIADKLEQKGKIPVGTTRQLFLTALSLATGRYNIMNKLNIGSEYVFALASLFAVCESFGVLTFNFISINTKKIVFDITTFSEKYNLMIREHAIFFNSIVRFGTAENRVTGISFNSMREFTKLLETKLFCPLLNQLTKDGIVCETTDYDKICC
jgi:hypothetical protein